MLGAPRITREDHHSLVADLFRTLRAPPDSRLRHSFLSVDLQL